MSFFFLFFLKDIYFTFFKKGIPLFIYFLFTYLFIYFWLCWVFVSVRGLSLVAASRGHSSSRCAGLSPPRPLPLRSTGSRRAGPAAVAHGPSCSAACGILPDQGPNPHPLHRQADSQPLRHQGSPFSFFLNLILFLYFLYSRFLLVIYFIHISAYMSIPISQCGKCLNSSSQTGPW